MPGVAPRGDRDCRMRLRRVFAEWRPDHVRGIEVGVECDGVMGVARERAEAVMMRAGGSGVVEGVGNRLGEHRVRADLDEGAVGGGGGGDRRAEPDRVAHVRHPVIGIEKFCGICVFDGADDRDARFLRHQWSQRGPQLGEDGVHHRGMGRDLHVHPAGEDVAFQGRGDDGVDRLGRTGNHRLARRRVHRHRDPGIIGDQCFGGGGVEFQQCHRALVGEFRH